MPKVSVIIPVYNAAPFLHQCLNSIINQTLADIEIILVNDGSTDGSISILNEYALMDNRVKIIDQENKGAGAARNAGLRLAKGEYLSFLDADDFFEYEMFEKLYNKCEDTGADIAIYKAKAYNNITGEITGDLGWTTLMGIPKSPLFSYKDVERFYQCCSSVAWDKFFKKSFVDECGVSFQEIRFSNDGFFVHTLMAITTKITTYDDFFVNYRNNISTSITSQNQIEPIFYQSIKATQAKLKTLSWYPTIEKSYSNWAVEFSLFHLFSRINSSSEAFSITYKALQNYIFNEIDVIEREKDFFYNDFLYSQIKKIISTPLEDYYFESVLDRNKLQGERDYLRSERDLLQCERDRLQGEHDWLQSEQNRLQGERDWLQSERDQLQSEITHIQSDLEKLRSNYDQLYINQEFLQGEHNAILSSFSFRLGRIITWFPRKVRGFFRRLKGD